MWLLSFWTENFLVSSYLWFCASALFQFSWNPHAFSADYLEILTGRVLDQHVTSSLELPSPAAASILCKLELNYYGLVWIIQWLPCFSCCCIMSLLMICTTEGRGCFLKLSSELFEDNNLFPTKPILLVQAYAKQNMCLQRNKSKSSCLLQNGIWEGLFEPKLLFAQASPCQSPEHRAWGFILSQLSQWELPKILSIGFVVFWLFWLFCY